MMKRNTDRPLCVDLFCGAGGLSTGLKMAGFQPIFAVDFDKHAAATYAKNHPETELVVGDIANVTPQQILRAAGGRDIDLLAGGPSCQGYSTHGKRKADDPRNFLFEHFIRIARGVKPKWILIENVQGLLTYEKGYFKELIADRLRRLGYRVDSRVLLAADYGVPQLRNRIFFLATRTQSPISFPSPTHGESSTGLKPHTTVGEAIADLPRLVFRDRITSSEDYISEPQTALQKYYRKGSPSLSLHTAKSLSEQAGRIAMHVHEGQGLRSVPHSVLPDRFKKMRTISNGSLRRDCTTLYFRLSRSRPSYTITCYFRNPASGPFLHPIEHRVLSYREAARLMSFPDRYEFVGASLARQIGNAVPPLLAQAVGRHLISFLRGSAELAQLAA